MTESLNPKAIETLAAGYVMGDLDRAEVEVFEQLLAENPAIVAEVKQLQATFDQVVYTLNSVDPPPHLQSIILNSAIDTLQTPRRKPSRRHWYTMLGTVAALLILYLGADNYRLRQDYRLTQDMTALLQQPETKHFSLQAVNAANRATGSFVVNLDQRQGILTLQNLPAPPANQVYRLWAIAGGETIPCGTVNTNPHGEVLEKFWMPADFYDAGISRLFVTLELSESSRFPTGPIVIQSAADSKV